MKRKLFIIAIAVLSLMLLITAITACMGTEQEETVRVMVPQKTGFTVTSQNPQDVAPGSDVTFKISIKNGYGFVSASAGEYDQKKGTLTVKNVTRNTNIDFNVVLLDYDTSVEYNYKFIASDGDESDFNNGLHKAGSLISVVANNQKRIFVGWTFGMDYASGGVIVSTSRAFSFHLSPEYAVGANVKLYANYKDANVFYYDVNGGEIDVKTYNMQVNDYYEACVEGVSKIKVTMFEKYFSFAECASTFFNDGTFIRDGYVLKEYNTAPDGSGEGFSLGSKFYTGGSDIPPVLYCIWEKCEDESLFTTEPISIARPADVHSLIEWAGEGVIITAYSGNADKLVIPEYVNGERVVAIANGAFRNKSFETLILPKTLLKVENGAFQGCSALDTLYFPNGIYEMYNEAFDADTYKNFKHLIVNAVIAPSNTKSTDGGFAVKLCKLLATRDEKQIIIISGSSSYQGIASEYMQALLDGEYTVINFGTTRPRPGLVYLEALSHYTDEGDIFVYAPENSAYMYGETSITANFLYDLEGMNNLFRYFDISNYYGYFSSFSELNKKSAYTKAPLRYEDIAINGYTYSGLPVTTDKNGDYQHPKRQDYVGSAKYVDTYFITFNDVVKSINDVPWNSDEQIANKDWKDPNNKTWSSINRPELVAMMNLIIGRAKESGAQVYFGFAPVDADKLVDEAKNVEWLLAYDQLIIDLYDFDGILGSCTDYIYNHKYAYDCAFHVNDYGRTYRTYQLYTDICRALGIEDINDIYSKGTSFAGCLFEIGSDGTPIDKVDYLTE